MVPSSLLVVTELSEPCIHPMQLSSTAAEMIRITNLATAKPPQTKIINA
jgi:hypothetical protein